MPAGYLYVDGIVGDVGQGVLRDRRVLAEEGVVVVVVTVALEDGAILTGPGGHHPRAGSTRRRRRRSSTSAPTWSARRVKDVFADAKTPDLDTLQRTVRRAAGRFVNDRTKRKPMIVPVVMEA